jgi:hypothetical protein
MSRLVEYRQLERNVAERTEALKALQGDPDLAREIEFESKLQTLLREYGKGLQDVKALLDPAGARLGRARPSVSIGASRRARIVKVYRNPLTGEVVESKGGNNKLLGAWKAQFGHDEVESWVRKP